MEVMKVSKYYGYTPKGTVRSAVESFESKTQVQGAGGMLLGTVYVDIRDEEWAVAIAYGRAHHPKIRGPEPVYEVRYAYRPDDGDVTERMDTRQDEKMTIESEPFPSVEDFVLWSLEKEKGCITGAGN
jgi:hypothetical protein